MSDDMFPIFEKKWNISASDKQHQKHFWNLSITRVPDASILCRHVRKETFDATCQAGERAGAGAAKTSAAHQEVQV